MDSRLRGNDGGVRPQFVVPAKAGTHDGERPVPAPHVERKQEERRQRQAPERRHERVRASQLHIGRGPRYAQDSQNQTCPGPGAGSTSAVLPHCCSHAKQYSRSAQTRAISNCNTLGTVPLLLVVSPAKAGVHTPCRDWIPASAGMTNRSVSPLSMLVYTRGLLGEGGGPCAVTELDFHMRRGTPLALGRNAREEHISPWKKGLGEGKYRTMAYERHNVYLRQLTETHGVLVADLVAEIAVTIRR